MKEDLEVEIILIAGALGVKALLGNSVDFSTVSGSVLAAAVRGVPVKLVHIIAAKPTFDLVAEPKIHLIKAFRLSHFQWQGNNVQGRNREANFPELRAGEGRTERKRKSRAKRKDSEQQSVFFHLAFS